MEKLCSIPYHALFANGAAVKNPTQTRGMEVCFPAVANFNEHDLCACIQKLYCVLNLSS